MNPRAAINDLLPFQGSPFGQLGYFSKLSYAIASFFRSVLYYIALFFICQELFIFLNQRREWDSNPLDLADKRFSRPPRYDHFDISPYHFSVFATSLSDARCILSSNLFDVNTNFYIFSIFFKNTSATSRSSGVVILIF